MEILAIIPARGGSQSIPRKNLIAFMGAPLISWSIRAGQHANLITRVVVSTDDGEIADVASSFGAEVPFLRPAELAKHDVMDYPVVRHCLDWLGDVSGYRPDLIVQLRPTSPLRPAGMIDDAIIKLLSEPAADSLRVVCEPLNNPFKMWRLEGTFMAPLLDTKFDEPYNMPRQKLPKVHWQIGTLDVIKYATVYEMNSLSGKRILPYIVDPGFAVDIDDEYSLRAAEVACRRYGMDVET